MTQTEIDGKKKYYMDQYWEDATDDGVIDEKPIHKISGDLPSSEKP